LSKKLTFFAFFLLAVLIISNVSLEGIGKNARRPAIVAGADRVVELQRADPGWEGTWYWYVSSTYNATNLTGVTALGLLEAFRDVKDSAYLDAAQEAANFIMTHLGAGAPGPIYHVRLTAPDIVFLYRLSEVTGDDSYATRASAEWAHMTVSYPTAGDLDNLFHAIARRSAWDIAFFLEAAHMSGDRTWADDAAGILADIDDTFYYGDTWWYALNVAGAVRALVGCGYFDQHSAAIISLLNSLIGLVDADNGVDGWIQDSAYAVLAFNTVGGAARPYANSLGRWLARLQGINGGWIEPDGYEYPEGEGEAVRALSSTIGANITLDGFEPGAVVKSSWRRSINNGKAAKPFNGN
jgi:hypothetical protein